MSKRIEIDGKFYRMRRGKLVEIPAEWVDKVPTQRTIRNRPSKQSNRQAREACRRMRRDAVVHEALARKNPGDDQR